MYESAIIGRHHSLTSPRAILRHAMQGHIEIIENNWPVSNTTCPMERETIIDLEYYPWEIPRRQIILEGLCGYDTFQSIQSTNSTPTCDRDWVLILDIRPYQL